MNLVDALLFPDKSIDPVEQKNFDFPSEFEICIMLVDFEK
jgi:hypothetical protein